MKRDFPTAACLIGLVILLAACHRTPDETLVRQSISTATDAAQQADATAFAAQLTDDFDGNAGAMARQDLANVLRLARLRGQTVHVVVGPVDIDRRGERYVANFTVTLTSGSSVLPGQWGVYKVSAAWRKDGDAWRCYQASWTQ